MTTDAAKAITEAIKANPNSAWLVLPGPVDLAPQFGTWIVEWLSKNGWVVASIPKDSIGRDLEIFWRIAPVDEDRID